VILGVLVLTSQVECHARTPENTFPYYEFVTTVTTIVTNKIDGCVGTFFTDSYVKMCIHSPFTVNFSLNYLY
jgi:hypothetical protein